MARLKDTQNELVAVLETALAAVPTAWEGVSFTPPERTLWARVTSTTGDAMMATLGEGGEDMVIGSYVVTFYSPMGLGVNPLRDQYEILRLAFPAGLRPHIKLVVMRCSRSNYGQHNENGGRWLTMSCTILYQTWIER